MGIKERLRYAYRKNTVYFYVVLALYKVINFFRFSLRSDKSLITRKYAKIFGRKLNLDNPKTLNEKIQWLKLYERKDFHTICADKYAVREWLANRFGDEYLIPLIFHTDNWREITPDNIKDFPCIIKANHTSGDYIILRDAAKVDWVSVRRECHWWLLKNYYQTSQEWQYKNIKRQIVVEKLLQTKAGKIPNDYKLHYINGKLEFVYVSVDREGSNKRNIYDKDWNPLPFSWVSKTKFKVDIRGTEIPAPASFDIMKEIGAEIARLFKYVRVDFYDVDGRLYFGEITLHHGGGFDVFIPEKYDYIYGKKCNLLQELEIL